MSSRLREMAAGLGIPGAADVHICGATSTNEAFQYWHKLALADKDVFHTSIPTAEAALTTNRNDVLLLTPENHSLAAALTWDLNMAHFVGMYGTARQNMRSRIGMSAAFSPTMTVSGYGNTFQNLYFMHGTASATNLNCVTDTGGRNSYLNCHFLGQDATAMDEATYNLIYLDNNEIYAKDCMFGGDGAPMSHGALVKFGDNVDPPRSVFENCIFLMCADAADPVFLKVEAGVGNCWLIFKNCMFLNRGTQLTYGIDATGTGNCELMFDPNCVMYDIADVCADALDANVHIGPISITAATQTGLMATYANHS